MPTDPNFYFARLYPFQDQALGIIMAQDTGFYLTGGTAVSRVYLQHRFSDDLDLFVNYKPEFGDWCGRVIDALFQQTDWQTQVIMRQQYFARILITTDDITLKVELINDVPSHVGEIRHHPVLGRIDSPENILANKLTALLGREEARDLADVWGLCTHLELSIHNAIEGAATKASGIYPVDLARRLCSATHKDWEQVRWINPPDPTQYLAELNKLGEELILI
jgi:hypothetical protein